ncbi:MAG: ribosome maturation factor RimM [Candidatus Cryptobacteroides sp.]
MAASEDKSLTDGLSQIASVLKSNGIEGEIVLGFRSFDPEDIDLEEPVFIIFDGLPVPFFIESIVRRGNSKALVHMTDIRTFEDAEELVGKAVYVRTASLGETSLEEDGFEALIGWTLLRPVGDESGSGEADEVEEIGEITDFIDIPGNPCLEVQTKNGAAMIPLHEDLILSVDPEYREIIISVPEGLLP